MTSPADIAGKTFVITGATSGIGLQTALRLAAMGGRLALVGRDRSRGEAACAAVRARAPGSEPALFVADLSRLGEVRRLAEDLTAALPRIDVLINNAGAIFHTRQTTPDGLERTFALNHLAYFLLTALLRERLAASAPARIVNVASEAHRRSTLDFDDLQSVRRYGGWKTYQRSKLCNILFTRALARRLAGTGVQASCLHPGFVASGFGDNTDGVFRFGVALAKRLFAIAPAEGAATSVHVATAPEVVPGGYYVKCAPAIPSRAAQDDGAAERLWDISAKLVGTPAKW